MASLVLRTAVVALALALACDTGFGIPTTIIVPKDVAAAYSKDSPGLLVVSFAPEGQGSNTRPLAVICGEALTTPEVDLGGDGERPASTSTSSSRSPPTSRPRTPRISAASS